MGKKKQEEWDRAREEMSHWYNKGLEHGLRTTEIVGTPVDYSHLTAKQMLKRSGAKSVIAHLERERKRRERAIDKLTREHLKAAKKKTFREFCEDSNLQELFGLEALFAKPAPPPQVRVLAHRNYQPGVLNKTTNKFTPREFTPAEQQRYGWRPVKATSYSPGDRFTPNKKTATGEPHNWTTMNAAVPFKYPEGQYPKGSKEEGLPSIPYGSRLQLTQAPMGTRRGATRVTTSKINDVGDFGPTGHKNPDVSFDLSPNTVRSVTGDRTTPNRNVSTNWGKNTVYTRVLPPPTINRNRTNKK